ncbi:MAG: hypothetical protein Q9187_007104 [Circinaria calcarea]
MDGLSAAASTMATVSLALQLANSTKKLYEFWNSIKDAPEDIHGISTDLEFLSSILQQIGLEAQYQPPDPGTQAALRFCFEKINAIGSLITDIEPDFASMSLRKRKWSAIKAVFRAKNYQKCQESLDRMKVTLLLAQQNSSSRSSRLQHESQHQSLNVLQQAMANLRFQSPTGTIITTSNIPSGSQDHAAAFGAEVTRLANTLNVSGLPLGLRTAIEKAINNVLDEFDASDRAQQSRAGGLYMLQSTSWSRTTRRERTIRREYKKVESFFGTIYIKSKTSVLLSTDSEVPLCSSHEDQYEHETTVRILPAQWLISLRLIQGLNARLSRSSISGWKLSLDVIRPRPDNAIIFDFCRHGNLAGVKSLFERGLASPKDVDSDGYTPLHLRTMNSDKRRQYAARSHHLELCKLLIEAGSDRDCRTNGIEMVTEYDPSRIIDLLRLFIDLVDVSGFEDDRFLDGSIIIKCMIKYYPYVPVNPNKEDVVLWMLQSFGSGLRQIYNDRWIYNCLRLCSGLHKSNERFNYFLEITNGKVDALNMAGGWSVLHWVMLEPSNEDYVCQLLGAGANAHLEGSNRLYSSDLETPTSIAMYSASTFVMLQNALRRLAVHLEVFVDLEMNQPPLQRAGWEKETLLALLSSNIGEPYRHCSHDKYCKFCAAHRRPRVQINWMHELRRLKDRGTWNMLEGTLKSQHQMAEARGESDLVEDKALENSHHQQTQGKRQSALHRSAHISKVKGVRQASSIVGDSYVEDEFMCVWCWREWEETGQKPLLHESICVGCGKLLRFTPGRSRLYGNIEVCYDCEMDQDYGGYSDKQKQTEDSKSVKDSDEDEYSPYLFQT